MKIQNKESKELIIIPPNNNPEKPKNTQKNQKRSWVRIIASIFTMTLTVLIFGVIGAIFWLLGSENGLKFAVLDLPKKLNLPIEIHANPNELNGTIWDGFRVQNVLIQTESLDLNIDKINLNWELSQLFQNKLLLINNLDIGNIDLTNKPTPPQPQSNPPKLPEDLDLPFSIEIKQLKIGAITQNTQNSKNNQKVILLKSAQANYQYYHYHHNHVLNVDSIQTIWSDTHGKISLNSTQPFVLTGQLDSTGQLDNIDITNQINLFGSLKQLNLKTHLAGLGIGLDADTQIQPFAPTLGEKIGHIVLKGQGINPKAFLTSLPKANLTFSANVLPDLESENMSLSGDINLKNQLPIASDLDGIPVQQLDSEFQINQSGAIELKHLDANLIKNGQISVSGGIYAQKQTLNLNTQIKNVSLYDLVSQEIASKVDKLLNLNGQININGTFTEPKFLVNVNTGRADLSGLVKISNNIKQKQQVILFENGKIQAPNGGFLNFAGNLELFNDKKIALKLESSQLNLSKYYPNLPESKINGLMNLTGELAKTQFQGEMAFNPSTILGAVLSGGGYVNYDNQHLSKADLAVVLGNNLLKTKGSFGKKGDKIELELVAPNMEQFGFGIRGISNIKGYLVSVGDGAEGWTKLDAQLSGMARNVHIPNAVDIQTLDFKVQGSPDINNLDRPLDISIQGKNIRSGENLIDFVDLILKGNLKQHHLSGTANLKLDNKPLNINLDANGGLNNLNNLNNNSNKYQWVGNISKLNLSGALNLVLQNNLRLEAGEERVNLSSARWQALGGNLNLEQFTWDKQAGLSTKGRADNLNFKELHNFYEPPIEHNLVLSGDWDLAYSQSPRGYLNIRQQSGDVILPTARKQPLNLNQFVLKTQFNQQGILSQVSGETRYGKVLGNLDILQVFNSNNHSNNNNFNQAPIRGKLLLDSEELKALRSVLPVGQTVQGSLKANVDISGQLNSPKISGTIDGEKLSYRNRDVGVVLSNGRLKSHFQDQTWVVDGLIFERGTGNITLTGTANYNPETKQPDVKADIIFNHYQILDQPNRRLTVSGKGDLFYNPTAGMSLNGQLKTDEGKFGFQTSSAPTLGEDVVILGETPVEKSASMPLNINLLFDLNNQFVFSGDGLSVLLGGKLNLTARPQSDMQAIGSVHIVRGQYKAYGQDLTIKKGIISFVGPLDNPNLNIRAERRNSPVGAGVEVLGNLNVPRINLVANEPMSEKDKLSWLILNRASSGSSGDNAALSAAAGAFLAGKLNDKVGLVDDFGLTSQQTRNAQTGEMNPAQQVLTFGKQLTNNLYLGYEAGLENASQSVKLVYQLSQSFQAILRGGTVSSGAEVKYIKRFDGFSKEKHEKFKQLESQNNPNNQESQNNQDSKQEKIIMD